LTFVGNPWHWNLATLTGLNLDTIGKSEPAQNGVVLELRRTAASRNCHFCQFADKWAERGYYDDSDVVLCVN